MNYEQAISVLKRAMPKTDLPVTLIKSSYDSPIGTLTLFASEKGLEKLTLNPDFILAKKGHSAVIKSAKVALDHFFKAQSVELPQLNWALCTDFQKRVLKQLCRVKTGKTMTYSTLATRVDSPKAARAIGSCMRFNPWPLLVPCHRIIPSSGGLGNYSLGGPDTKSKLLDMEQQI